MKYREILVFNFIILLCFCNQSYSQSEKYYICKTSENNKILLEDHYTRDLSYIESDTAYDSEVKLLTNALMNYGIYSENQSTYYLDRKLSGFEMFTNINIGDYFYLSASVNTYHQRVIGYEIDFNDIPGGGNIFYIVLENDGIENSNYFIATINMHLGNLDTTGVSENDVYEKFSKIISKQFSIYKKNNEFESEPMIKVFKGFFVDDMTMQMRPRPQYLVTYVKRTDFDKYTSAILIYDQEGNKINELSTSGVNNFYYSKAIGVILDKSINRFKILTETGYYEGSGLDLFEFNGTDFISIADGFSFGV